jgi:hypothetical protein
MKSVALVNVGLSIFDKLKQNNQDYFTKIQGEEDNAENQTMP